MTKQDFFDLGFNDTAQKAYFRKAKIPLTAQKIYNNLIWITSETRSINYEIESGKIEIQKLPRGYGRSGEILFEGTIKTKEQLVELLKTLD